jgi:hypothetical protein
MFKFTQPDTEKIALKDRDSPRKLALAEKFFTAKLGKS